MSFPDVFQDLAYLGNQQTSVSYSKGAFSTAAAYGVLIFIASYYIIQYLNPISLPVSELLWNLAVWVTPSRIIIMLDRGFKPVAVEKSKDSSTGFNSRGHASKSNAIRRILGLDGSGMMTTVHRTRTLSNMGSVFKATPNDTLPGLGNWDNSCYQNSILQGLAALESLPAFLDQTACSDVQQPTKSALRGVIRRLNDPANVGKTIWTPPELKSMSSWQQQDAQEYFSKISDGLEKDTAKVLNRSMGSAGLEGLPRLTLDCPHSTASEKTLSTGPSRQNSREGLRVSQLPEELLSLIIRNPLEGLLAQRVGCQHCGYVEGLSLVPFNCLTVPLGKQWMYDVRSCLDDYTALEPIAGVECAKCTLLHTQRSLVKVLDTIVGRNQSKDPSQHSKDSITHQSLLHQRLSVVEQALEDEDFSDQALKRCQVPAMNRVSTTKTRQAVVARAPRSLVIHVNRSNFDELTGVQSKNSATVRYPRQLDLAPWCLGEDCGSGDDSDNFESWNVDPSQSMLSDGDLEKLESTKPYELRAVVTHYGRHENGHYICYRKSPFRLQGDEQDLIEEAESWWRLSDEEVTEVDENTVLSQGGVFMLFYEQPASLPSSVKKRAVLSSGPATDVGKAEASAKQDNETSIMNEHSLNIMLPPEQPPVPAESALPTPPPSPSRNELDVELSGHGGPPLVIPSGAAVENTRTSTQYPSPSQMPEPVETSASTAPPVSAPSPLLDKTSKSPISESGETIAESPQTTPIVTIPKENQPVTPTSMRTAGPRKSRGSVSRAGKAMGSIAGFVQAN